jgi:hypothetical protein
MGGGDQVVDAHIDRVLQIGPAGRRLRRQPIQQVHVLLDQASIIERLKLPRPDRQQRAANDRSRAQSELSQTRHVNSSSFLDHSECIAPVEYRGHPGSQSQRSATTDPTNHGHVHQP